MTTAKKLIAAAGAAGAGEALYVEDVFSTYLYTGDGTQYRTIENGIDIAGEGGLVWIKNRDVSNNHYLQDTERGAVQTLSSNINSQSLAAQYLSAFETNGFTTSQYLGVNQSGENLVSWTFRKQPGFFDIVTYTGNSQSVSGVNQTINHNLGTEPGMIIVKRTDGSRDWAVYHRSLGATKYLELNNTDAEVTTAHAWVQTPTSTEFYLGQDYGVNGLNHEYVAYLFAHNDGDGEFGEDGDQDIIKCGSYTGNNSSDGPFVDLGFEPQWLLIKESSASGNSWSVYDMMRDGTMGQHLRPNSSDTENIGNFEVLPQATGFKLNTSSGRVNRSQDYIYIAIRRGPMKTPEGGTEVFAVDRQNGDSSTPTFASGFPVDMAIRNDFANVGDWGISSRLTGNAEMKTNDSSTESAQIYQKFDYMDGYYSWSTTYTGFYSWMFRRAPGFFDVVAYEGDGSGDFELNHNLGVAPEMIWLKPRSSGDSYSGNWHVWHTIFGTNQQQSSLNLNSTASLTSAGAINPVHSFASDNISPNIRGGGLGEHNKSTIKYIVYLFASVDGISKVGSYTGIGVGTGSAQDIDCGFTNGARFVLIKRTDSTGSWMVFDVARGITVSSSPLIELNDNGPEQAGSSIQPFSSGFRVVPTSGLTTVAGAEYIFYAIA